MSAIKNIPLTVNCQSGIRVRMKYGSRDWFDAGRSFENVSAARLFCNVSNAIYAIFSDGKLVEMANA